MTSAVLADERAMGKGLRTSVVAGSIGVLVHWFDWAVYAYMATTMAKVFFPEEDGTASLLSVFAVFAIAFFVRPIGSVIFGFLGDRFGRRTTLSLVIVVMAAGTLMLALIPGHQTIGIWAPILLIVARVIQGIAAGGEFGSAATFLAEYSPARRRGMGTSWLEVGSVLGFLLASFVVWLLHATLADDTILAWGWRLPFLITVPLALIGLFIRLRVEDTLEYRALEEQNTVPASPVTEAVRRNGLQILQTIGIETFMNCTFYVVLVYLLTYQEEIVALPADDAALLSTIASLVAIALIPLSGMVSDRVGRKPVLLTAAVLLIVAAIPLFALMRTGTMSAGFVATALLAAILAIILGTHSSTVAELFPTRTRQSGLSIAYSLASALFAGTLPYINTWLIDLTGSEMVPAYTLIVVGLVGLVTILTIPETRGIDLLHESDLAPAAAGASAPSSQRESRPATGRESEVEAW
ncbi:MFS transporter [Brachybacterium huguangmaarense]|uniref:MFS transporter n=1 Tax=Brachybacterium huguangmaarense TaxID=1652028 RepID=A0ABY6G3N6_9MICO|nr:MFS transporter [Brachybacterium huguangmaarense]UYG17411.1 MFS transporter [Brachybacterium huguangmaarense]